MTDEGSGVLYVATTEKRFLDEAIRSALSVKRVMDLPITLVTDLEACVRPGSRGRQTARGRGPGEKQV
jgi:hypothetical protein